jgi:hypothetical protein
MKTGWTCTLCCGKCNLRDCKWLGSANRVVTTRSFVGSPWTAGTPTPRRPASSSGGSSSAPQRPPPSAAGLVKRSPPLPRRVLWRHRLWRRRVVPAARASPGPPPSRGRSAPPVQAFPPSIFRDKNRCDIGQNGPPRMETPGVQARAPRPSGRGRAPAAHRWHPAAAAQPLVRILARSHARAMAGWR